MRDILNNENEDKAQRKRDQQKNHNTTYQKKLKDLKTFVNEETKKEICPVDTKWNKDLQKTEKVHRTKDEVYLNKVNNQYNKLLSRVTKEVAYYLKTDVNDRSDEALNRNKKVLSSIKDLVQVVKNIKELKTTLSDDQRLKVAPSIQAEGVIALQQAKEALVLAGFDSKRQNSLYRL